MKKLILFLAFLLPLGLQAKCPSHDHYQAVKDFKMNMTSQKKETIAIKKDAFVSVCSKTDVAIRFAINTQRYETSKEEFDSHIDNGDLKEVEKPAPKPKTVQCPILH